MQKACFIIIAAALLPVALGAQQLAVLSSGGQHLAGGGVRITATVGEVCVGNPSGREHQATEGFQQGDPAPPDPPMRGGDLTLEIGRVETLSPALSTSPLMGGLGGAVLFPNPAVERVQIALSHAGNRLVRLRVFDNLGRLVQEAETAEENYEFDLSALAAGHYWLSVLPAFAEASAKAGAPENRSALMLPFEKINR